jgi:hypothetical protein
MSHLEQTARGKHADLASAAGAGLLGAGLGVLLAQFARPYAIPLVAIGILLHGWGMLEKGRLESGKTMPRWATALYWLCWLALAALAVWMGAVALR